MFITLKNILKLLTPADKILIVFLAIFTGFSYVWVSRATSEGKSAVILVSNKVVARYPLDKNIDDIKINAKQGEVHLRIKNNRIKVTAAACPNKTCMGFGWQSRVEEIIACIPNQLLVKITGDSNQESLDALSR